MDNVVHPEMRRWITPPVQLGERMATVIEGSMELGLVAKFDTEEARRQLLRQGRNATATQPSGEEDIAAFTALWEAATAEKEDEEEANSDTDPGDDPQNDESDTDPDLLDTTADTDAPVEDKTLDTLPSTSRGHDRARAHARARTGVSWIDIESDDDPSGSQDDGNSDQDSDFMDSFHFPTDWDNHDSEEEPEPVPEQDLGNDEGDTLDKWMKMGLKSGPHRLLSGDTTNKKFTSFIERAFSEKTAREYRFAEQFMDNHMDELGCTEEQFKRLQKECSPAIGAVPGESFKDEAVVQGSVMPVLIPPIPDADKIELKSLGVLLCSTNPTGPIWRSNNVQQQIDDNMKLSSKAEGFQNRLKDYADDKPGLVDNSKDFLIEVSVFCGRNPDESLPADVKLYTEPKLVYKLHLLGTNTVADLRSKLHCDNELVATAEVQSPDDVVCRDEIFKHKIKTWVLVLGNQVFGEGANVADALTDWVNEKPPKNLGPFEKGNNETRLRDLTVRFGYPYVYIHVGKCEHVIVFNQARMIYATDEYRIEKYPVMASIPNLKNVFCRVDNERMATWSVLDCAQFPENPMLICTTCLRIFCYNHDGTKRLPFRLFPFRQLANEI